MIYLIDDDRSVRRGFEMFLKSAEMELVSFENAEDFLTAVKPAEKDILILDLHLPGMNGCDMLKKMSLEEIHIPVIVVTAFDDVPSRECCRQYGVKAYLRKPVDGEALSDMIKYILTDA
jgi:FixJ family two-component response regulator